MAQQGMFGNYQQQIADETALRRQSAQTGGLTGWAAITNAMSGIGSEIGYQGGQAMGGMTPVQAEQARFETVMNSFDFDPTNPDSMMEGSAALNAAGFYDKGLEMFNLSNKVRSDNLSYDILKMQKEKLENPDDKMIQQDGVWYYVDGDNAGDRVLTADVPEKKRDMRQGADGFYRYVDGDKERVFPELTAPSKDRPMKKGVDGFLRFLDGDKERVFPELKAPDKERQVRQSADGYYRYTDGDKERVFPEVTATSEGDNFGSYTPTAVDSDAIDKVLDENYDFGAFDFDFWGLGDKAGSMSSQDGVEVLRQKVFNIYKNSDKLFGKVLTFEEIIERYPNPADLMAVKIGGSGVSNNSDEEVLLKKIDPAK